jgi:hypothetical protein
VEPDCPLSFFCLKSGYLMWPYGQKSKSSRSAICFSQPGAD